MSKAVHRMDDKEKADVSLAAMSGAVRAAVGMGAENPTREDIGFFLLQAAFFALTAHMRLIGSRDPGKAAGQAILGIVGRFPSFGAIGVKSIEILVEDAFKVGLDDAAAKRVPDSVVAAVEQILAAAKDGE